MAKKKYSYKFRRYKRKKYSTRSSINYVKGKIGFEFVVAVKNGSSGSQGEGYYFWDVDFQSTTASPLMVRQLLSASNEFNSYKDMYTYYKVNGILIESIPAACNSNSINWKTPIQIQTSFTTRTTYNNALILNPYNYCKQYIKSFQSDFQNFDNNSDSESLGVIKLITQQGSTITQSYAPIFTVRISIYMTFKKNINA